MDDGASAALPLLPDVPLDALRLAAGESARFELQALQPLTAYEVRASYRGTVCLPPFPTRLPRARMSPRSAAQAKPSPASCPPNQERATCQRVVVFSRAWAGTNASVLFCGRPACSQNPVRFALRLLAPGALERGAAAGTHTELRRRLDTEKLTFRTDSLGHIAVTRRPPTLARARHWSLLKPNLLGRADVRRARVCFM